MRILARLMLIMALLSITACKREAEVPAEPIDEAPAVPTDEVPAEPTDEAPAEPTDEAPAERPTGQPSGPEPIPPPDDVAEPPEDALKTESGLVYKILKPGDGEERPGPRDQVEVHYTGWTVDGSMFDSSVVRGQPTTFPVNRVIAGWTEGLQLMRRGEKARFWIPADLAYGERPQRPGAPAGMLVFDVELIDIKAAPSVDAPEDVAGPPEDAERTESGLAYKVLEPGEGDRRPVESDVVQVHYTGWTTDGEMFDSSVLRGQPATFPLAGVIRGWTEGLQLMKVGEKTRFWIPAEMAYGETPARPGAPAGMLVFDVELLGIQ